MFIPNNYGQLSRKLGANIYGERTFQAPVTVPCAIVDNTDQLKKTPVRADSSASRGAAEEDVSVAKILFPANIAIAKDDTFAITDLKLRVTMVQKRFSVFGVLDHLEVDFDAAP
jgi:hypothetical protein